MKNSKFPLGGDEKGRLELFKTWVVSHAHVYGVAENMEIYLGASSAVITYCDVQGGWEGEGNIDCNPQFCYPDTGDFYLNQSSCCVGAGQGGADIGAFGVGCGAEPIPTLSEWGMIILALLILVMGTVAIIRRRRTVTVNQ